MDFKDKKVVVTGKFSIMTRAEITSKLKDLGAVVGSGVTKKTDLLIAGEAAGSKLGKARQYNITVMDEIEFRRSQGEDIAEKEKLTFTGPLSDVKERIDKILAELGAHPDIKILMCQIGPNESESTMKEMERFEEILGHKLPTSVRNFFLQYDGIRIFWDYNDAEHMESFKEVSPSDRSYDPNWHGDPLGGVLIPSFSDVCMSWSNNVDAFRDNSSDNKMHLRFKTPKGYINEYVTEQEFNRRVRGLNYKKIFSVKTIFFPPNHNKAYVAIASDYGIDLDGDFDDTFEEYIESLLNNFFTATFTGTTFNIHTRQYEEIAALT